MIVAATGIFFFVGNNVLDVYFSPNGGCTSAIIRCIDAARSSILIQAYSFTSAPIAAAVVGAKKRGVLVIAILDKGQRTAKYSSADFLAHSGIETYIDSAHAIAHNKIIVIDRSVLITGSFNFTASAEERNSENLLVFSGYRYRPLVKRYIENFELHKGHSVRYYGR